MVAYAQKVSLNVQRYFGHAVVVALIGAFIYGCVVFAQWNIRWHNGIWAGMHQSSALFHAEQVMVVDFGAQKASTMHFGNPPAVHSHSTGLLNAGQIWVVHVLGKHGEHYCVSVWSPQDNWSKSHKVNIGSYYSIRRGCSW